MRVSGRTLVVTPTPYSTYRSYRSTGRRPSARRASRAGPGLVFAVLPLLALVCAAVVGATVLTQMGVHVPGARRVQAYVAALPLPWKAPRPEFVPAPEPPAAGAPAAVPQAPAIPAGAQTQAQPTAAAATPA